MIRDDLRTLDDPRHPDFPRPLRQTIVLWLAAIVAAGILTALAIDWHNMAYMRSVLAWYVAGYGDMMSEPIAFEDLYRALRYDCEEK